MATDTITQETADKVAAAVMRAGMTKSRLAELSGIPYSTLGRKLNADTPLTVADLFRIAQAIGVDPAELAPSALTHLQAVA